ncbi:oxidoreductase [Gordonia terrae]|uniref:Oxidoreductase n=2 Tax=Gordonia terrae TaxID=2055 RepID=A0AAD0NVU8_9ACTN|nr:oxidoreductase [Gordonia terrae]VTR02095.1 acyl-CoA dehydrogenase family protein [Clostridioides difficile]ANY23649.1 oxidoreductase [Gordonia terrae]AWO84381.1 oxidoreductase [Gordonia terrae]VTS53568.1 Flavin-dependent monooxygenase, oxygenase subunit HsaA [Gordonia terrae]GAB41803.1 putative oxidoreductase [Gordonia terrae NBRC 100016]
MTISADPTQVPVRPGSIELDALLDRIADGSFEREHTGTAPHEQVRWLKAARLGAYRLTPADGGGGATVRELFDLVIRLSRADSNLGHLLRAHYGTVEDILLWPHSPRRELWLQRVAAGELIGNGNNELSSRHAGDFAKSTTFTPDGDGYRLDGVKYYSTGTLYSEHTFVTGVTPGGVPVQALIPLDRPGIIVEDDWDGFGQSLTGTGTTRFEGVSVLADEVTLPPEDLSTIPRWHLGPFYQHYLNAVVAGNALAIVDDAVNLLRGRTRSFTHGSADVPREDPVLLEVVGEISSLAQATRSVVLDVADDLARIPGTVVDGRTDDAVVHEAALRASQAQVVVDDLALRAATLLFDVGGASAVKRSANLDRHWRNIRTVASHNPTRFKNRAIGDLLVNDTTLPDNTYF